MIRDKQWEDQDCYIVGGGPSLRGFDWRRLASRNTIGCNLSMPFPAIAIANDARMIRQEPARTQWRETTTERIFVNRQECKPDEAPWAQYVPCCEGWGTSFSTGIVRANNCGLAAINLAEVLGATCVYLLGFDMRGEGGLTAQHHDYYPSGWKTGDAAYDVMMRDFVKWLPSIRATVINLNPESALDCFPRSGMDGVI